jgi:catechol 2,3-dioxygenase-like lactoylglutathione lyase family enzyme
MIGYVTLGTNDLERAAQFYDLLLKEIGASRFMENDGFIAWAISPDKPALSVTKAFDGKPATVGNGVMVALAMRSSDQVDSFYKKAMELGATDEGAPGPRGDGFYAGYFRDLDGNKLNAFCMG